MHIEFPDKLVTYETFTNDLAERIAHKLQRAANEPFFISQRKAYSIFGRANVERWRRTGQVRCYKRPGKVEYRTADLRLLQATEQDYLKQPKK
ncbi:hypothetical protein EVA_11592 [gut metagenome]|uniref:Uncharacterized protein n=1 Tax=gut metagenome TaxID=749906 RepID=J9G0D5_9ZZZZ